MKIQDVPPVLPLPEPCTPDDPSSTGRMRARLAGGAGAAEGAVAPPGEPYPSRPYPRASYPDGAPRTDRAPDRRILWLHLPRFAIERATRIAARHGVPIPDDLPWALATEGPHGRVIHATNRAAETQGVHPGARAVDMRALCPELRLDYADTGGDAATLGRLMLWMRRWCPWTAVDGLAGPGAGLVLDITGSAHLAGGEAALMREIEGTLGAAGYSAALAVAPTQGAAWALAHYGRVRDICTADALTTRLSPLPVRALRLDPATVVTLQRLGLKAVGDVMEVPRLTLARRFVRAALPQNPLLRLDQAMGRLPEPVTPPQDPPRFIVDAKLAEPIQDPTAHLPGLCETLAAALAGPGFGARRLSLSVFRTDGEIASVEVATSEPSRDPAHLARLFDGKLENIDPGYGFDLITLAAITAEKLNINQARLDGSPDATADLAHLIDRLSARFGAHKLRRPARADSHIPERREVWTPAMAGTPRPPLPGDAARPVRLLHPPEEIRVLYAVPEGPPAQFIWRRQTSRVTRFAGPERIAPEWWADRPGTRLRDYYRIEDETGRRLWIFREGVLGDGRDDHEGGHPRWFVHGMHA